MKRGLSAVDDVFACIDSDEETARNAELPEPLASRLRAKRMKVDSDRTLNPYARREALKLLNKQSHEMAREVATREQLALFEGGALQSAMNDDDAFVNNLLEEFGWAEEKNAASGSQQQEDGHPPAGGFDTVGAASGSQQQEDGHPPSGGVDTIGATSGSKQEVAEVAEVADAKKEVADAEEEESCPVCGLLAFSVVLTAAQGGTNAEVPEVADAKKVEAASSSGGGGGVVSMTKESIDALAASADRNKEDRNKEEQKQQKADREAN